MNKDTELRDKVAHIIEWGGSDFIGSMPSAEEDADEIIALVREHDAKPRRRKCEWKLSSYPDDDIWETQCGNEWLFISGGIKENDFNYCPYCGHEIAIKQLRQDDE